MSLSTAFDECDSLQIKIEKDWYELSITEKSNFLDMAKRHDYRDPKNKNGRSKGYCFYLGLQRLQKRISK